MGVREKVGDGGAEMCNDQERVDIESCTGQWLPCQALGTTHC